MNIDIESTESTESNGAPLRGALVERNLTVAGAGTFFSLTSVLRDKLIVEWGAIGLGKFVPAKTKPKEALRRAMGTVCKGARIEALAGNGYIEVKTTASEDDVDFSKGLKVKIVEHGGKRGLAFSPSDDPRIPELGRQFQIERSLVSSNRVRYQLINIIEHLNGMTLSEHGHIYFVPETGMDTWRAVAAGLSAAVPPGRSAEIYRLTTVLDDDARKAAHDALEREIAQKLQKWEGELESDELTKRIVKNRHKEIATLRSRLQEHTKAMGVEVGRMNEAIRETEAHLVAAALGIVAAQ